jgi:hypothetical protein
MNNNQNPIKNINEFIEKIDEMKKQEKMDLSSDQDLSIAIMNLIRMKNIFSFLEQSLGKQNITI